MSIDNMTKMVLNLMYNYQKKHNITKQCITNSIYLRDTLLANDIPSKVKPAIAVWTTENNELMVCVHMFVQYKNNMLDPSFEVFEQDAEYYDKINTVLDMIKGIDIDKNGINIKDVIATYLKFIKIAERINNGECLIGDKKYYHSQADYVEQYFKRKIINLH